MQVYRKKAKATETRPVTDRLFLEERLNRILALIEEQERVSVSDLSELFGVSAVTIRNDLATLEQQGCLVRTHGGAVAKPAPGLGPAFAFRQELYVAEKERIGKAAAALIRDGDAIALDDSSTAWQVARHLRDCRELTVVTNSLYVALEFLESPGVTVVMPGGTLRPVSASLVGDQGDNILDRYHVQKGFLGARGVTLGEGLTDPDQYGAELKRRIVERSKEVIIVVDASKWNQVAFATFATWDQVDRVITDQAAPSEMVAALRERGIQVTVV